jgi:stearoyl-CoA desaturase (delta-9 desaturase)
MSENLKVTEKGVSIFVVYIVVLIHIMPFAAFTTPFYVTMDLTLFFLSYTLRVFALTGGYHRYFSHKSFQTSRFFQFFLAYLGACALQGGPLWWASHHRYHHHHSDTEKDSHSPKQHGFWYSHVGWFMKKKNLHAHYHLIRDFSKYPELRLLERYWYLAPLPVILMLYLFGGWNAVVWGFFVPTAFVNNVTYAVNSLVHVFGGRRYHTKDDSRNNLLVALFAFGEGWHNNHHRFAGSARQGFAWYQLDITYLILKACNCLRLVSKIKPVPENILKEGHYLGIERHLDG